MPSCARPQSPATAAVNASGPCPGLSASGARAIAGSPWMARNSGLWARSDGDRPASSHACPAARVTSVSSSGSPGMAAAKPTRRPLTSNRWTGAKAGRPDSTPDSSASVPRPYADAAAAPVTTTEPVPLRAAGAGGRTRASVMRGPDPQIRQQVDHAGDRGHAREHVVVDVERPVALLDLVDQPGQFQRVDRFRYLLRPAVAVSGEHRDNVRPLQYAGHPSVGRSWLDPRQDGAAELADGHAGEHLALVIVELHPEPVFHPHGEFGEGERLQIGAGRAEHGVVVDTVDAVVHVRKRVEHELADLIDHGRGFLPMRCGWHASLAVSVSLVFGGERTPARPRRRGAQLGRGQASRWPCAVAARLCAVAAGACTRQAGW